MIIRKKFLGGLLKSRAVRDIFREHIKPSRMYQEVLQDFKKGAATKADKIRTAITGLRAYANAYYKQSLKAQKADKNPKTKKGKARRKRSQQRTRNSSSPSGRSISSCRQKITLEGGYCSTQRTRKKKSRGQKDEKDKEKCEVCGKTFTETRNLKRHMKAMHNQGERFVCGVFNL